MNARSKLTPACVVCSDRRFRTDSMAYSVDLEIVQCSKLFVHGQHRIRCPSGRKIFENRHWIAPIVDSTADSVDLEIAQCSKLFVPTQHPIRCSSVHKNFKIVSRLFRRSIRTRFEGRFCGSGNRTMFKLLVRGQHRIQFPSGFKNIENH